ncbi:MAG: CpaF family protein [Candidatus Omnitrophica bacterium]|nr:CpaF family protein [Candidatus Omnitrophota bacterium]
MINFLKEEIKQRIIEQHKDIFSRGPSENKVPALIAQVLEDITRKERIQLTEADKNTIITELVNELIGFGPLEYILKDPEITEIMVNGPKKIFIEKSGKKQLSDVTFESDSQLMNFVQRILSDTRRRVDETNPYTDFSLRDGSRVNIVISPVAVDGTAITIRKLAHNIRTVEDLIEKGTIDRRVADFLIACIKAKLNMIFSGATGAGKTTTLNVLSSYINENERIITIEDTTELKLNQNHVVRLETKQANIEGKGRITIRELFVNCLRMRPDRIILGEIRGVEALDMLQAICSGHKGSLAIIHGNSPQDIIYRIETMILTSGIPITLETLHRQMAAAINLIIQQEQMRDGSRKITYITQVNGLKDGKVNLEDIFVFEPEENLSEGVVRGRWVATGVIPNFYPIFKKAGINLQQEIFNKGS